MLEVKDLTVSFQTRRGVIKAVDRLSFSLGVGKTLGVVGESGSGKSVTSLAILGLLAKNAEITSGEVFFFEEDLMHTTDRRRQEIRGGKIAMIFQDPMTSLNPCYTIGYQIEEALRLHERLSSGERQSRTEELLTKVGIPDARLRMKSFPHQLSGGMSQRAMIAMAIACGPKLLIADEPTTALDVTIQAQILSLLRELKNEREMSMILITHDIGVVAENADQIIVMYAGQAVEMGDREKIIEDPQHPYTQALLESLPGKANAFREPLPSLPGMVPDLAKRPSGCQFHPRCKFTFEKCRAEEPPDFFVNGTRVKCWKKSPIRETI